MKTTRIENGVSLVCDNVPRVLHSIADLLRKEVLVGVPDSTTERDEEADEPITNATLAYIHEFGAPEANIPARPFLIPGVEKALPQCVPALEKAADSALDGNAAKSDQLLHQTGLYASASAKREISTANFVPLRPETVANRRGSRSTKSMRKSEQEYFEIIDAMSADAGVSPDMLPNSDLKAAESSAGIQPLVNTGALRNSLTYVVRKK